VWKKSEEETTRETPQPQPPASSPRPSRDLATIGASIKIKGDLSGDEDLLIQGHVNGEIRLPKNKVTIGASGRVEADVYGKNIQVEGQVKGNLYGEVDVIVRASGRVQGNIVGPRVTLENGANFKGSIDMEPTSKETKPQGSVVKAPAVAAKPDKPAPTQAELNPATSRG
jgi:cytoskeletal protein CcmA (bactofilin family)